MRKYRNKPVTVDGIRFDSKKEYYRWCELKQMEKAGKITRLTRQERYHFYDYNDVPIAFDSNRKLTYVADFAYFYEIDGNVLLAVEDVKGMKTPVYKIKKALMKHLNNIDIIET